MRHRVHPESFIEGGSAFTAYYESLDGVARDIADFAPSLPPFTKDTICTLETFDGVPLKPIEIDVVTFVSKMLGAHEKEEARAAAPAW
jgi:hypothetical protein